MKLTIIFLLIILSSCSETYLIRYSVTGTATTATLTYYDNGYNIEENITIPWTKDIFIRSGELTGISVLNTSDGKIDGRVFFKGNNGWQLYKRQIDENFIMIKGVINSIL